MNLPRNTSSAWRRWRKAFVLFSGAALLLWFGFQLALRFVPLPAALFEPPPASLELYDRHGQPLRKVRSGETAYSRRVTYEQVPQSLIQATLAAEDSRFWSHGGVDWRASVRALVGWVKNRRVISGGSTITQQLIKLAQPRPRTLRTKLIEAAQALRLEQVWDKPRILTEYLNRLNYGNLALGPVAAAEQYFGKPLPDLSTAEAAFLAGLPQSPGRLNPRTRFERAHRRQQWILSRLQSTGRLSATERARSAAQPLPLAESRRAFHAPHFVDLLLQQFEETGEALPQGRATTTLDLELNSIVERALGHQLGHLRDQRVHDGAVVVLENRSGEVLALVGSGNYFAAPAGQVNGAWARRSAGSTLKPFTYLLALEQGATPATIVDDLPTEFATATGVFAPENYNRRCYGPMRYRLALANSLNISAVKVLQAAGGPEALQDRLQEFGLTTLTQAPEHYGLGLTIGNAEVRLLELANAYAALARLGEPNPWRLVGQSGRLAPITPPTSKAMPALGDHGAGTSLRSLRNENGRCGSNALPILVDADRKSAALSNHSGMHGKPPEFPAPPLPRVLTPKQSAAWLIADVLADNQARTLAFGADSELRFDFPVACKTGTSSDFRDNWAIGFTPEFTVGVWMGNFDGTPMRGVSGVSGAAPVLHGVFDYLHARFGTSWFGTPSNIVERLVHPLTGKLLLARRPDGVLEKFFAQALPPVESPADYDSAGRVRLSPRYKAWLASGDNSVGAAATLEGSDAAAPIRIVSPLPGTTFFLDLDLPPTGRAIPLRADGGSASHWESETLECRAGPAGPVAVMREGRHRLSLVCDETGQRWETWVIVKNL